MNESTVGKNKIYFRESLKNSQKFLPAKICAFEVFSPFMKQCEDVEDGVRGAG